ncbi:hypothetical protein HaLaN_04872, partial [Haematococcus lacustris]
MSPMISYSSHGGAWLVDLQESVSAKAKEAVGKMFGSSSSTGTNTEAGHAQEVQPSSSERGSGNIF